MLTVKGASLKYLFSRDERRCAEVRIVKVNSVIGFELGLRVDISRQSTGLRIQLGFWEIISYVKYGLYQHEIPGTPAYNRMSGYRSAVKQGAQSPQESCDVESNP